MKIKERKLEFQVKNPKLELSPGKFGEGKRRYEINKNIESSHIADSYKDIFDQKIENFKMDEIRVPIMYKESISRSAKYKSITPNKRTAESQKDNEKSFSAINLHRNIKEKAIQTI